MKYRPEIDGLRALAVIPVILFHAGSSLFSGGFVGVDIFFVISGYLITTIIIDELDRGTFSIVNFYERRARRILPALFLVMLACIPFAWFWLLPGEMKDFSRSIISVSFFVSNVFFWRDAGYFGAASELKPLLHTWSLAVEEQFYIIFPLFLLGAWRFGKRVIVVTLILLAISSLFIANWASFNGREGSFFLLPTRGWELLIGCLAALYISKNGIETKPIISQSISLVGIFCILFSMLYYNGSTPFPSVYGLVPTIGTALIILFANNKTVIGKLLGSKPFVGVGLLSYSAYLWHQPILAFARHKDLYLPTFQSITIIVIGTLTLSYFSWRYVESYFRQRGKVAKNTIFTLSLAGTALFICAGALGALTNGFEHRIPAADRYMAGIRNPDMGKYVSKRFIEAQLKEFSIDDKRKKVVIIGDSFSKDLVNAVYESPLKNRYQISTYYISGECGNLYIEEDFSKNIKDVALSGCRNTNWYNNEILRLRLREADEIWLSSNWQLWVAELLPKSVANLQKDYGKRILVFGSKRFGDILLKKILNTPSEQRSKLENMFGDEFLRVNKLMQNTISPDKFINVSELLCSSDLSCHLLTSNGDLISHDGTHLTPKGAEFLGSGLSSHPLIH